MTAWLRNRVASSPGADLKTQRAKEIAAQVGGQSSPRTRSSQYLAPTVPEIVLTGDDYVGVDLCVSAQPLTEEYSPLRIRLAGLFGRRDPKKARLDAAERVSVKGRALTLSAKISHAACGKNQ